jgi:putative flavoprotein involved in K+ transport
MAEAKTERVDTLVIGGGQAGLSVGYHLARHGVPFLILDGSERIGDAWRQRWDSLHLFTPAKLAGLDGLRFPAPPNSFPTKDAMADYLELYARTFALPVRSGVRVNRLSRLGDRFVAVSGARRFEADHVIVAMANYQRPRVPPFARDFDARIVQLHSFEYRRPSQLQAGDALVVGAGNSGAEIAIEVAREHRTWLAGPDTGHIPFRIDSVAARLVFTRLILRGLFHRVLTINTPIGRKVRPQALHGAAPLIRLKPRDLKAAGVIRVPRVAGVRNGQPLVDDGRLLEVSNVIWCTGYDSGSSWIDRPVFDADGDPRQDAGVVESEPGLYFVGLHVLYAFSSEMIHGVGRDAARIARIVASRAGAGSRKGQRSAAAA